MASSGSSAEVKLHLDPSVLQGAGGGGTGGGQGGSVHPPSGEPVARPLDPQPPGPGGASHPQPQQVGGGAGAASGGPVPGAVGGGASGTGAGHQAAQPTPGPVGGGAQPSADWLAGLGRQSAKGGPSLQGVDPSFHADVMRDAAYFQRGGRPIPDIFGDLQSGGFAGYGGGIGENIAAVGSTFNFGPEYVKQLEQMQAYYGRQGKSTGGRFLDEIDAGADVFADQFLAGWGFDAPTSGAAARTAAGKWDTEGRSTSKAPLGLGKKSWFFGTLSADVTVNEGETQAEAEQRAGRGPAGRAYAYVNAGGGVLHNAMAISPTADLQMMGGLGNLGAQAGLMTGNPYLAAGGAAANVLFGQLAQSGNYLYGKGTELAQLERYRAMSQSQGVDLGFGSDLIKKPVDEMGFKPGEATWMAHGFYSGIGHGDASKYDSTQAMRYYQRLGVGMGQQAHFLSLDRAQTGNAQDNLNNVLGTGATMGLAGQGLEQFLSRIAAATEGMRDRGLQMDEKSLVSFTKALQLGSDNKMDPQRAAIMATGLGSSTANLAQSMVGGFGGIVDAALMSASAKEGGNYFDMVGRLQDWSGDPTEVYKRLTSQGLSEDTVAAGFMGKGWNVKEARRGAKGDLAGGLFDALGFTGDGDDTWKKMKAGLETSKALAKADLEVNTAVSNNTEAVKELTAVMKRQGLRNVASGGAAATLQDAVDDPTGLNHAMRIYDRRRAEGKGAFSAWFGALIADWD